MARLNRGPIVLAPPVEDDALPHYELAPKAALTPLLADPRTADRALNRVALWLANRGYIVGAGAIAARADGTILIDADRDPSAEWSAFDPALPTPDEVANRDELALVRSIIAKVDNNTATAAEQRKLLVWTSRQAVRARIAELAEDDAV